MNARRPFSIGTGTRTRGAIRQEIGCGRTCGRSCAPGSTFAPALQASRVEEMLAAGG